MKYKISKKNFNFENFCSAIRKILFYYICVLLHTDSLETKDALLSYAHLMTRCQRVSDEKGTMVVNHKIWLKCASKEHH